MLRHFAMSFMAHSGLGLTLVVSVACNDVEARNLSHKDLTPPTITSFTVPSNSFSPTVSGIVLTATDNKNVTGYLITETSGTPSSKAIGWNSVAPTRFTFRSSGSKVLYAWAKDAAGNISTSKSASVTITSSLPTPTPSLTPTPTPTPTPITSPIPVLPSGSSFGPIPSASVPANYCEATGTAKCYYVAADGNDLNPGTYAAPFKTFRSALVLVNPGDFIYARGGIYGMANAMVQGIAQDPRYPASATAPACPPGETAAQGSSGWYCNYNTYSMISIKDFGGWGSSAPAYKVKSGLPGLPITVKAYPGEKVTFTAPSSGGIPANAVPCSNCTPGTTFTPYAYLDPMRYFVAIGLKSYWVIEGFDMDASFVTGQGVILIAGGNTNPGETHDIIVRNNQIHDYVTWAGSQNNVGMIKIDRGDLGGPWNIFIRNNSFHRMSDPAHPGDWKLAGDSIHYGAITTLSRENYYGVPGGGTGFIEISGNVFSETPQTFYFKNPAAGPIEIHDNLISDAHWIAGQNSSNVHFIHNLVHGVPAGFSGFGNWWNTNPDLIPLNGQNMVIRYNTFVGLNTLISTIGGTGHLITNNVFFGMQSQASTANWDTPSYLSFNSGPSDSLDPMQSLLTKIQSDKNCFFAPTLNFQMASRYLKPSITGTADWKLEHYDPVQARTVFGYDPTSIIQVQTDPVAVFVNPTALDYHLKNPGACAGMGYYGL